MEDISELILKKLVTDEPFCRKVLPFLKLEYFEGKGKFVYKLILSFVGKYNALPNCSALEYELENSSQKIDNPTEVHQFIQNLFFITEDDKKIDQKWLMETTEKWCKDRSIYLAVIKSINIIDGKDKDHATGAIPDILSKALSVTFDRNIGHDYVENASHRYDYYHKLEDRIPFDLEMMNTITGGGVTRKTLNILMAGCVHPNTLIKIRLKPKTSDQIP
jgi:hypothetical protein